MTAPKPVFKDAGVQEEFASRGYVKLPWLNAAEVAQLRAVYAGLGVMTPEGFSFSMASADSDMKSAVRRGILQVFEPKLDATFISPSPLACSFYSNVGGGVGPHQDWTLVDETAGEVSITIWCPLEPTNHENGNLSMVPKSNHLRRYPRLAGPGQGPYHEYYELLRQAAVAVPTQLGEAILFDSGTVHCSSPNQTASERLVAATVVVPQSASLVLYYQNEDDASMVDEYRSSPDYFIRKTFGERPEAFLRTIPRLPVPGIEDEIRSLYPQIITPQAPGGGRGPS